VKKLILLLLLVATAITTNAQCSQLFISEYGEPNGGNGKYVEIYNPTADAIDLGAYEMWRISNGGSWTEATLSLSGSLEGFGTYVIANNSGDVPGADVYNSGFCVWNGDDAVGLALEGELIDAIGEAGGDPGAGWDVAGVTNATKNHTLVRKASVDAPNTDWTASAGTNTADSEWIVETWSTAGVGSHTSDCYVGGCTLTISQSDESSCNDNGTNADASDDWFSVDFNASSTAPGASNEFEVVLGANMDGTGGTLLATSTYGTSVTVGDATTPPFVADGASTYDITIRDKDDNTCHATYVTATVESCSVYVAPCSQLFISEYGEPNGGNGKYIEIYNPTADVISLDDYEIWKISNGGSWAETTFDLTGTIDPYSAYVIANNAGDVPGADVYASSVTSFNGDDAMGLALDGTLIDSVGEEGPDPGSGWDVAGVSNATKNHTIIRKEGVDIPNTNWGSSAGSNTSDSEWIVVTYSLDNIGMHTSSCAPCSITMTQNEESACHDNGTTEDGTDDWFTITFNADGTNAGASNTYEVVIDANVDGTGGTVLGTQTYGTSITVGDATTPPFMADGATTYEITIRDMDDNTCHTNYTTNTVASCYVPSGISIICPDNIIISTESGICEAVVNFADASAIDAEDGALSVVQTVGPSSGSSFPLGQTTITFSATDSDSNTETCSFIITVVDNEDPVAVCQDVTIELDEFGLASIDTSDIDNGSTDNCTGFTLTLSKTEFDCSDLGTNTVILTVTDANNNTNICTATVTVEDNIEPIIACEGEASIQFNQMGDNPGLSIPDNNPTGVSTSFEITQDDTIIDLAVLIAIGHTWVGDIVVNLTSPAGTTVNLIDRIGYDGTGFGCSEDNILAVLVDGEFFGNMPDGPIEDACPPEGFYYPQNPLSAFAGESSLGTWTLTVSDNAAGDVGFIDQWMIGYTYAPPYTPIELSLGADGTLSIPASDLLISVNEACDYSVTEGGNATVDFDCSNLGENAVMITVTDAGGNTATCTSMVNISDVTAPELVCEDTDVELGVDGTATIDPYSLMSSWTEACGIDTIITDVTEVSCEDIGTPIQVTIFANDASGNFSSCQSMINVVDIMAPDLTCPGNMTVPSDNGGIYTLPDYYSIGEATATDNCTDVEDIIFTQDPAPGTVFGINVGTATDPYLISFTAEDQNGNIATCEFELMVKNGIGVSENKLFNDALSMVPNPATNKVQLINKSSFVPNTMMIFDINGRLVSQINLENKMINNIDISNLTTGVFLVKIISDNASAVKRLVKK